MASQVLSKVRNISLDRLIPAVQDYMTQPISVGFTWHDAFADVEKGLWYLVAFRSRHHVGIDTAILTVHDERAHEAAKHSRGFIHYFIGTATPDRYCLSFCLWTDQTAAQDAARHPAHQEAQRLAHGMYEHYKLERYLVRKTVKRSGEGVVLFEHV